MIHRASQGARLGITAGLLLGSVLCHPQGTFHWRDFTSADGLPDSTVTSVTVGPRGNIWLNHDESPTVTRFDGYEFESLPFPGTTLTRIFEGRSTQLWAVDKDAILQFSGGTWLRYPLSQIRADYRRNIQRVTRPVSLIPLRVNNVLILLSDQLIRFDSRNRQVTLLKEASELQIGAFRELIETSNQTMILTAERGIALAETAPRLLTKDTPWQVSTPPARARIRDFHRPTENGDGSFSMVAIGEEKSRFVVTFKDRSWQINDLGAAKLRLAWKQSPDRYWGLSYNNLFRIEESGIQAVGRDEVSAGLLLDAAIESPDVFFVASSEGLYRHARSCWRRPAALADIQSPIHGAFRDAQSRLWFISSVGLLLFHENRWQRFTWPEESSLLFRPSDQILRLSDTEILISHADRYFRFNTTDQDLDELIPPSPGQRLQVVGSSREEIPIVLWQPDPSTPEQRELGLLEGDQIRPYPAFTGAWPRQSELEFIEELPTQEIWFGDQEGIGRIESNEIEPFGSEYGVPSEQASGLIEMDNGRVWASIGSKIYEYDGRRWKTEFNAQDRIHSMMLAADESVWVASNQGLHRFHFESWVTLTTADGLAGNAVYSILEDEMGRIWAGTARGIYRYHADADLDPPRSNIRILASSPDPVGSNSKHAVFEARDKWDFTPQDRLLFSYRLDERPWTPYSEKRDLILENLSAGQHRLEVRAMDRNWNEEEIAADYEFTWIIPWHQDPRLVIILATGCCVILLLAGLAINRHFRLTRSYAEVERIVALRTRELEAANQELLQTQKMRALGTLTAGIAHDFNGILSIIKGSTQIIESNLDKPDKVKTRLQRIQLVVDQGAGVIRAMLGIARSGEKHRRLVDLNEATETTIQLMGDRLPADLTVRFEKSDSLIPVRIVVDLLQQTLINIISNASDAMEGHGVVRVSTGFTTSLPPDTALKPGPGNGFNSIAIRDSGYGISEEILPRIFEPFFTSKSFSTKRGTGLGLSMVYEMAKEMEAGLAVESTAGEGSTFTLYLPVDTAPPENKGPENTP